MLRIVTVGRATSVSTSLDCGMPSFQALSIGGSGLMSAPATPYPRTRRRISRTTLSLTRIWLSIISPLVQAR